VSVNFSKRANIGLILWVSSHYKDVKFSIKHNRAELGKKGRKGKKHRIQEGR